VDWDGAFLTVYHGTTRTAAQSILSQGIDPMQGRTQADFGRGFYTTTSLRQAFDWARLKCSRSKGIAEPAVVEMRVDRNWLSDLRSLVFVIEGGTGGYWDFILWCRGNHTYRHPSEHELADHRAMSAGARRFDVVFGPVSLYPQRAIIKDCDQISFYSPGSIADGIVIQRTLSVLVG
jgi:hypothetical protein